MKTQAYPKQKKKTLPYCSGAGAHLILLHKLTMTYFFNHAKIKAKQAI